MFVAKDKSGKMYLFNFLPIRDNNLYWMPSVKGDEGKLVDDIFPDMTFDDDPREVHLFFIKTDFEYVNKEE